MEFVLNGKTVEYNGDMELSLLKYLRLEQGITSPKDGCSGQGACGACTVEMDGKAILSCVTPMKKVEDKSVTTIEGVDENFQKAFAKAFVKKGGVQCGFCTPGIVMSAKVLLSNNPNPSREDVKKAINRNICRCTGYKKIVDSVLYTAEIIRGEDKEPDIVHTGKIGTSLPKYEAEELVLGKSDFVADMKPENLHFGALKFSEYPRAKIISIDTLEAEKSEGVIRIVKAKDVTGDRMIGLINQDWPLMIDVGETVNYTGDVLAGVVAKTEEQARQAVKKIKVEYEVLEPVTNMEEAVKPSSVKVHESYENNILAVSRLKRGNTEKVFSEAAYISKGTYHTQRIEHAFIEPEACLCIPEKGELNVYTQGQGVYEDRKQIAKATGLPLEKVKVTLVHGGGGFGGKEDLTVQGHASLFALLTGVPVMVRLTRDESISMHPKRHPMRLEYEVACDDKGTFTALKARIIGDTGAYASVGAKVLERAAGHAGGAYEVKNVDIEATAVYTNNVPCGAMRGFGVNQAAFAFEACIDDLCEQGGFDRWQIRYDNALDVGKETATGQILGEGVGLKDTLLAVKDVFQNAKYAGIACGIKNVGVGNGKPDDSRVRIVVENENHVVVHHGWTEMGQGVHTMAIQTVCEITGIKPEIIEVKVETGQELVTGMTTSSRGTSLLGNALAEAARKMKKDLDVSSLKELMGKTFYGEWICDWTTNSFVENPEEPVVTHYSYGFATQVAVLNDDGNLAKIYAAHDAGRIMNPVLFEGQIEGAVHMGAGYALTEDMPYKDGYPESTRFAKLGIIRAKDMPDVEVIGVESDDPIGPFGAKGIGEIGLVPTAPAIVNAFYIFDGIRRYSLPIKR